jgi:hypothetical protein
MLGQVTMPELQRTVSDGQWDCLWIAAHGNPDGFLLADGLVRSAELVQLVGHRFALIVLNSCESLLVGSMLQNDTPAAVVVTQAALPDRTAYLTAANFARELAHHGDPQRAYRASHPGGANIYLYLAGMSDDFLARATER